MSGNILATYKEIDERVSNLPTADQKQLAVVR